MDPDLISALLREHLSPWQEKVVRLYFGLGCSESHPAAEIAQAFGVSPQMISGTVHQAQTKLTPIGLTRACCGRRDVLKPWPRAMWTGNQFGIVAKDNRHIRTGALFTNIGRCPAGPEAAKPEIRLRKLPSRPAWRSGTACRARHRNKVQGPSVCHKPDPESASALTRVRHGAPS